MLAVIIINVTVIFIIILTLTTIIIVVMQRWSGSSTKSVGKVAEEEKAEGILAEKVSGDQPWGFAL